MKYIFKNQQLIPEKNAQISIKERGFLFGDGIFESCKIFAGKIYDFPAHEARIEAGLKALKFSADISDLEKKSLQLIAKNKIKNGILRISISRGIGSAGYLPTYESPPLIIIETLDPRPLPQKISLGISTIKKPSSNFFPINHKTTNALPYVLAKLNAQEKNLFDYVILSQENFISETSSANIFWIKDKQIFTPAKSCGILVGTVRQRLLKISPIKIKEVKAKISALKNADEIFLTNSSFLITGVDELANFHKEKKTKKLQKNLTMELAKLLQKDVENSCKK